MPLHEDAKDVYERALARERARVTDDQSHYFGTVAMEAAFKSPSVPSQAMEYKRHVNALFAIYGPDEESIGAAGTIEVYRGTSMDPLYLSRSEVFVPTGLQIAGLRRHDDATYIQDVFFSELDGMTGGLRVRRTERTDDDSDRWIGEAIREASYAEAEAILGDLHTAVQHHI